MPLLVVTLNRLTALRFNSILHLGDTERGKRVVTEF